MDFRRVIKNYLFIQVGIIKIHDSLEFSNNPYLPIAYANSDFLNKLGLNGSIVNVYPLSRQKKESLLDDYDIFLILGKKEHFLKIRSEKQVIEECIGIPKEWFTEKRIYRDTEEVCIKKIF